MKNLRYVGLVVLMLVVVNGCERARDDVGTVVTGTAHSADGAVIAYDVRAEGDISLVFIHGWACDRSFWREQLDIFAQDYRVVAIDLGGHGDSQADRDAWPMAVLGGDVQAVVQELNLNRVVLIGHSLGGMVSLEAARLMPERVLGVVGVDTLHDAEQEYDQEQVQEAVARLKTDFQGTMASFINPMFSEQVNPELVDWVISKACSANQEAVLAISLDTPNLDLKQSFLAAKVPIRCINAAPHPPMNTETKVETNRKYADFDVIVMEGVGHFLMLERPAEFNTNLRQILSQMRTP